MGYRRACNDIVIIRNRGIRQMRNRMGKSGKDRLLDAVREGEIKNILMAR